MLRSAGGEIVLFDRSWHNRAGVERVMGFCSDGELEEFFRTVPEFEKMLVCSGIQLIKYWFSISDEEQEIRFLGRIHDPLKQWKLTEGPGKPPPLGRPSTRQGRHAGAHPYPRRALVGGAGRRQEDRAPELHPPTAQIRTTRPSRASSARERHEDYERHPVPASMIVPGLGGGAGHL